MRYSLFFIFFTLITSCKNSNEDGLSNNNSLDTLMNQYRQIHYNNFLWQRNETPMQMDSLEDIIRLHYDERYGVDYTYFISRQRMGNSSSIAFILYAKAFGEDKFITNGLAAVDFKGEGLCLHWDELVSSIDSLRIFEKEDHRKLRGFGNLNIYVLEVKINGTYREIYIETYAQDPDPDLDLLYIHELFKKICPPAIIPKE